VRVSDRSSKTDPGSERVLDRFDLCVVRGELSGVRCGRWNARSHDDSALGLIFRASTVLDLFVSEQNYRWQARRRGAQQPQTGHCGFALASAKPRIATLLGAYSCTRLANVVFTRIPWLQHFNCKNAHTSNYAPLGPQAVRCAWPT